MPRDANGSYNLPAGTIVSSGDVILPSQHNPAMNDIAAALTSSLSRNGVGSMLADLNMGGFSLTNVSGVSASTAGNGRVVLVAGTSTISGYVSFQSSTGVGLGYIGQITASGALVIANQNGNGFQFSGGNASFGAGASFTGAVSMSSTLGVGGNVSFGSNLGVAGPITGASFTTGGTISTTGNLAAGTASVSSNLGVGGALSVAGGIGAAGLVTGGAFTTTGAGQFGTVASLGFVSGTVFRLSATQYVALESGDIIINAAAGMYVRGRASDGKWIFYSGGNAVFSVSPDGSTRQTGPAYWNQVSV